MSNKPGEFFDVFRLLYTDDGAFMFASREDMIGGTNLLHTHLQRMSNHVQLKLVKPASPRLKQYNSPVAITLLITSNQIMPVSN